MRRRKMFHVPYDVPLYCCAGLKMVHLQIEQDYFNLKANGYALCDKNPGKLKKYSKCKQFYGTAHNKANF